MRKGRSQRKARASLPPRSLRPSSSRSELGASEGSPQVVIAAPAPHVTDGHEGDGASSRAEVLTRSERSETFEPASVDAPSLEPMVLSNGALDVDSQDEPHRSAILTPSEISIPPVGDLAIELEPVADRFFSEGETVAARLHGEDAAEWELAETTKATRKSLPEVVQRRARLAKYVRWAVGGASLLCVAALGRTMISPATPAAPSAVAAAAPQAPAPKAATPEVAAVALATAATPPASVEVPPPPAAAPTVELTAAAPEPTTVAAPKVDVPKAEAPAAPAVSAEAPSGKTALQEKNDARRSLERGKTADAIEAGERSVALDTTDGEAWLLLGAAYQEKGKGADARRCYTSCVKEGKRGPIGECRAMLR